MVRSRLAQGVSGAASPERVPFDPQGDQHVRISESAKIACRVLAMTALGVSLAACGSDSGGSPAGSSASSSPATETSARESPNQSANDGAWFDADIADLAGTYLEEAPPAYETTKNPFQEKVVIDGDTVTISYRVCNGFGEAPKPAETVGKLVPHERQTETLAYQYPDGHQTEIALEGDALTIGRVSMPHGKYYDIGSAKGRAAEKGLAPACEAAKVRN